MKFIHVTVTLRYAVATLRIRAHTEYGYYGRMIWFGKRNICTNLKNEKVKGTIVFSDRFEIMIISRYRDNLQHPGVADYETNYEFDRQRTRPQKLT